jgi:ParB-like chromosome segregation protein Spo0J
MPETKQSEERKFFVPADQIFILELSDLGDQDDVRFNPRGLENGGFAPENMESLKHAIKTQGLDTPLLVRKQDKGYGLLAGERRLRSILQLIEDDEECFNPATNKIIPASALYLKIGVECKVKECKSEIEYLKVSIGENVLHEPLTDYDLLIQLNRMERANVSRGQQAETMHKSEAWVSQSHSILASHPQILSLMKTGKLSRTAAITFINIPKDKIEDVLNKAIEITFADAEKKVAEGIQEREVAMTELETASTTLSVAQFTGDEQVIKKTRRSLADAGRKINRATKKITSNKSKKVITDANVVAATREVKGAGNKIRRSQNVSEVRVIAKQLAQDIEDGEVIDPSNGCSVDMDYAKSILNMMNWFLNSQDGRHPITAGLSSFGEIYESNDDEEEEDEDDDQ